MTAAQVDDAQTAHADLRAVVAVHALVVRAAMLNQATHGVDDLGARHALALEGIDPCYATHGRTSVFDFMLLSADQLGVVYVEQAAHDRSDGSLGDDAALGVLAQLGQATLLHRSGALKAVLELIGVAGRE